MPVVCQPIVNSTIDFITDLYELGQPVSLSTLGSRRIFEIPVLVFAHREKGARTVLFGVDAVLRSEYAFGLISHFSSHSLTLRREEAC